MLNKKRRPAETKEESAKRICCTQRIDNFTLSGSYLSRVVYKDRVQCELVIGTCRFLSILGANLGFSLQAIAFGLIYLHQFFNHFKFHGTERKFVAGACLLLSWKYWEDLDGPRSSRKLIYLPRMLYRLQNEGPAPKIAVSSSSWILSDEGKECAKIRERLKVYENALLRAIDYNIGPISLPFSKLDAICRRLCCAAPGNISSALKSEMCPTCTLEISHPSMRQELYSLALGICMDFFHLPFCLDYDAEEIALAAAWKAGVALRRHFACSTVDGVAVWRGALPETVQSVSLKMANSSDHIRHPTHDFWMPGKIGLPNLGRMKNLLCDMRHVYTWFKDMNQPYGSAADFFSLEQRWRELDGRSTGAPSQKPRCN